MKKTFILFILGLLPLIASAGEWEYPFAETQINGISYYIYHDPWAAAVVSNGDPEMGENSYSGSVSIPSHIVYEGNTYPVTRIVESAFAGCEGLTSVTIPNSITDIGYSAFGGCTGLTSITLPSSVTTIGNYVFAGCTNLKGIYCHATEVPKTYWSPFDGLSYYTPLFVPEASVEAYKKKWDAYFRLILPLGTEPPADVTINETNFPDESFRNFLLSQEYGTDGVLSFEDLDQIYNLDVSNKGIKNLKGIEHFFALDYLYIYQNSIKGEAMDALIEALPVKETSYRLYVMYNTGEQNEMTAAQVAAAKAKGWRSLEYNGGDWGEYDPSKRVEINETNFPDANFRSYLLSQSYGSDGIITSDEIRNIKVEAFSYKQIQNLKGIEYFIELTHLYCNINSITLLDPSNNTKLSVLDCSSNRLTSLDVSKNTALTQLNCYSNQLTSLDLSNNTKLSTLSCYGNKLTSLNVSGCTSLSSLECYNNQIRDAEMDAFVASLPTVISKQLKIVYGTNDKNVMTIEQVAAAKAKGWIPYCYDGEWKEYEGYDPSINIEINETNFPDANFRAWLLEQEYGVDGMITSDEIASINNISVGFKDIQSLQGIEFFTELTMLQSSSNKLTSLDVSACKKLHDLYCDYNQLTSLNVSGCPKLSNLYCNNNQLTSLDVSGCPYISMIRCFNNQLSGAAMDAFIETLPTSSYAKLYVIGEDNEQNVMTTTQVAAAKAKNWTPYYYDWGWKEYAGSEPAVNIEIDETNFPDANFRNYLLEQDYGTDGIITSDEIEGITDITVSGKDIESLEGIGYFKNIQYLYCDNNKLTSLDVSNNTALYALICSNNKLTSLNVSGCSNLYWFFLSQNQIKGTEMDAFIESLPTTNRGQLRALYYKEEGNVMTAAQVAAAKAKGWVPAYCTGQAYNEEYDYYYDVWKIIPDAQRGDVNGDGVVNGTDIQAIINLIVAGEYDAQADVNADGTVNGTDIQEVINIIVGGE